MNCLIGVGVIVGVIVLLELCEYLVWWIIAHSIDDPPKYKEFLVWLLRGGRHK